MRIIGLGRAAFDAAAGVGDGAPTASRQRRRDAAEEREWPTPRDARTGWSPASRTCSRGSQDGSWERHHLDPGVADFTFGNPQELPLPGLVDALQRHAVPQNKDWFAYKMSEEEPRTVVAESLRRRTGIAYRPEDVAMTAGAFGALGVTIRALCDVGDEVIYLSPPWFFYELMIASAGATAVRVDLAAARVRPRHRRHRRGDHAADPGDHRQHAAQPDRPDLPRARAARAGRRPAGGVGAPRPDDRPDLRRVVQPDRLRRHRVPQPGPRLRGDRADLHLWQDDAGAGAADRLRRPSTRRSRTRTTVGYRIFVQQLAAGWGFPNALLQHAIRDLEGLSIDIAALQARRDRMVPALREHGLRGRRAPRAPST